ncbi:hypothetical protein ACIOWM_35030 [Streptomyces anulatus]
MPNTTPTLAELSEEQREARRTRARNVIEERLTETWPAWRRPGRKPNLPLAAGIALDALGDLAAEILVDGTMMRSVTIRDGVATLELAEATEMVRIFAAGMRGALDGATNYVEMEMTDGSTGEGFTVTIRRRERPTPHELRQQAEARVEELTAELAVARQLLGTTTGEGPAAEPSVDRRARYAAAIREADGWVLDDGQHMIDAVMAVADSEIAAAHAAPPAPADRAALTDSDRQFLTFALELAADQMAARGDEFDDEDEAALLKLRALATPPAAPATDHRPEPWFWGTDTDRCPHGAEPDDDTTAAWGQWADRHPWSPQDVRVCLDAPMGEQCAECSEDHGAPVPWTSCDERAATSDA